MITFDAIFIPKKGYKNSYFLVSQETYKDITGFTPITFKEFFDMFESCLPPNADDFFYQNPILSDKIEMFNHELIFSSQIDPTEVVHLERMIVALNKENRIKHINIQIKKNKKLPK